jgi:hypothetical protein
VYQSPDPAPSSGLLFAYLRHLPLFLIVYDVFSKPASTPKTESPCRRVAMQIFILNLITKVFLMSPEFENVQLLSMNASVSRGFETITLRLRTSQRIKVVLRCHVILVEEKDSAASITNPAQKVLPGVIWPLISCSILHFRIYYSIYIYAKAWMPVMARPRIKPILVSIV